MFTGEEICEICNVSQNVVSRVKAMPDSPFFLNKCRPEWFLDWMRKHPEFQLTKAPTCEVDYRVPKNPSPPPEPKTTGTPTGKSDRGYPAGSSSRPSAPGTGEFSQGVRRRKRR